MLDGEYTEIPDKLHSPQDPLQQVTQDINPKKVISKQLQLL